MHFESRTFEPILCKTKRRRLNKVLTVWTTWRRPCKRLVLSCECLCCIREELWAEMCIITSHIICIGPIFVDDRCVSSCILFYFHITFDVFMLLFCCPSITRFIAYMLVWQAWHSFSHCDVSDLFWSLRSEWIFLFVWVTIATWHFLFSVPLTFIPQTWDLEFVWAGGRLSKIYGGETFVL